MYNVKIIIDILIPKIKSDHNQKSAIPKWHKIYQRAGKTKQEPAEVDTGKVQQIVDFDTWLGLLLKASLVGKSGRAVDISVSHTIIPLPNSD